MTTQSLNDCFLHDKDRLSFAQSIALLQEAALGLGAVTDIEDVPLSEAVGRMLARGVVAPRNIPAHDNAAVDGFAFRFCDYDPENGCVLPVSARIAAGHPLQEVPAPGTAARIFTGAVMPPGFDTVAMQEDARTEERDGTVHVHIPPHLSQGTNRRKAGEDAAAGAELLQAGTTLRPQDLAAIASVGQTSAPCRQRVKVGVFSTGDELLQPGDPFREGGVYDSNSVMIRSLVTTAGAVSESMGVIRDDPAQVRQSLSDAAAKFNVIITSGGVSRGEEDHLVEAMRTLGKLHLWQIAIKPGRPLSIGQIGNCLVVGLPGNPVAAFVCFLLYVRPALIALSGAAWPNPRRFRLPAAFTMKKKTGRREFLRGMLIEDNGGQLRAKNYVRTGSGLITSLREADGLIEIGEDVARVSEGDYVNFLPFSEFGIFA